MVGEGRDFWQATTEGFNTVVRVRLAVEAKTFDVRRFYLWSTILKRHFFQAYEPSELDTSRPPDIYRDLLAPWMKSRKGNDTSRFFNELIKKVKAGDNESRKIFRAIASESSKKPEPPEAR